MRICRGRMLRMALLEKLCIVEQMEIMEKLWTCAMRVELMT